MIYNPINLIVYLIFFLISYYLFLQVAKFTNLIDYPREHKTHSGNVPLIGGLIIYSSLIFLAIFYDIDQSIKKIIFFLWPILIIGILDDLFDIKAFYRIFIQALTCCMIFTVDIYISNFGIFTIDHSKPYFKIILYIVTIICVMIYTNGLNFLDGIDGLAASISLSVILLLLINNFILSNYEITFELIDQFLIGFFISLLFFLLINLNIFPLEKIFLGDSGSTLVGFLIAWMLIHYSQNKVFNLHPVTVIWMLAIPCFDLIKVTILRVYNRNNVLKSDRLHIHYLLQDFKIRNKIILLILFSLSMIFGIIGILLSKYLSPNLSIIIYLVFFVFYFYVNIILKQKLSVK